MSDYPDLVRRLSRRIDQRRSIQLSPEDLDLLVLSGAYEALVMFTSNFMRDQARERLKAAGLPYTEA